MQSRLLLRGAGCALLVLVLASLSAAQLSGTYTIDPNGSGSRNYTTFSAATAAVSAGGVSGPVLFNVTSTTFKETVTVNSAAGMSATNTVTFAAAGNPAIIDANNATMGLTLAGACQYYVFDNIEVKNATQYTLNVAGPSASKATFCTFKNCKFDAPASASSQVRSAHLNYCNDMTFLNCYFGGGGYTAYSQQINRCMFDGCEYDGKLLANYVIAPFNSNDANNTWQNCFFHDCGPSGRGLYFNWSSYGNNFFHNVIIMKTTREAVYMGSCCAWSRCQAWRNNIIVNLGAGSCAIYGYENSTFGGGPGLDYNDLDHNCYFAPNTTAGTVQLQTNSQGFAYAGSLSGWQAYFTANKSKPKFIVPGGGSTYDDNSIEGDPGLVSMTAPYDIHLKGTSICLDAGTTQYIAGPWVTGHPSNYTVKTDFEGETRPATLVDIGADEVLVRLVGSGSGQPGTSIILSLFAPSDAGLPYVVGSSLGPGPIPIDTRWLGLSLDALLDASVNGYLPMVFQNFAGFLDASGKATAKINIPNLPGLQGIRLYSAFLTLKQGAPSNIQSISNTFLFTVQ